MNKKYVKQNGVVFTPTNLANFMSSKIFENITIAKTEEITIIEPAAGNGSLIESVLKNAIENGYKKIKIYAFDIDISLLNNLKSRINHLYPYVNIVCICQDFIDFASNNNTIYADIIISNPPYVRTQYIDKRYLDFAKDKMGLNGKIDLYQIFICMLNKVLKPNALISIVISNKFIINKTGQALRHYLYNNYEIKEIYDFGDTKLFNAAVLPAVLVLKNSNQHLNKDVNYISIYSDSYENNSNSLEVFDAINNKVDFFIQNSIKYKINYGKLHNNSGNWHLQNNENDDFLNNVSKQTKYRFADFAKIRVGIKTTADKVFISNDWDRLGKDKPELLKPLITHNIAGQYYGKKDNSYYVLYPYVKDGDKSICVNLDDYPNSKKYLQTHYETLANRKYINNSNKKWFEIWVPHSLQKWEKSKIVFRDITEHPMFWIANKNEIVNGDCYWFDFYDNITEDIFYLILAIANSAFIEKYYDIKFNNKLYSKRRRFMTQYVENFPVFSEDLIEAKQIVKILKKSSLVGFLTNDEIEQINTLVEQGFNQRS